MLIIKEDFNRWHFIRFLRRSPYN